MEFLLFISLQCNVEHIYKYKLITEPIHLLRSSRQPALGAERHSPFPAAVVAHFFQHPIYHYNLHFRRVWKIE